MDEKALRNARKNLIGGAILLPFVLIIQVYGLITQGKVSLLWVLITVACVLYMVRGYKLVQAAKVPEVRSAVPQPSLFGPYGGAPAMQTYPVTNVPTTSTPQDSRVPLARLDPASTTGSASPMPVAVAPLPLPGWYRDPRGETRWWDGRNWTEHVKSTA